MAIKEKKENEILRYLIKLDGRIDSLEGVLVHHADRVPESVSGFMGSFSAEIKGLKDITGGHTEAINGLKESLDDEIKINKEYREKNNERLQILDFFNTIYNLIKKHKVFSTIVAVISAKLLSAFLGIPFEKIIDFFRL